MRLAINESRQSIDNDLNLRALYAAESGLEDAKRVLGELNTDGVLDAGELASLNGDVCDVTASSNPVLSADLDTEITCQKIDLTPGDFEIDARVNESVFIPLFPFEGLDPANPVLPQDITKVQIEWHFFENATSEVSRPVGNSTKPTTTCWGFNESENLGRPEPGAGSCNPQSSPNAGNGYAAMLRTGLFAHPVGGATLTRADFRNNNNIAYLNPVDGPGTISAGSLDSDQLVDAAKCDDGAKVVGQYFCSLEITDLSSPGTPMFNYLRLTPLYREAKIRVTMYDASDNTHEFVNVQAQIDVTGQAGDVVRRLEARIPLRQFDVLPDEAITTATQLCKQIVNSGGGNARDVCPDPNAPPP